MRKLGVSKLRSVENVECEKWGGGKWGVWKMRSVGNEEFLNLLMLNVTICREC